VDLLEEAATRMADYWWPARPQDRRPPHELVRFLSGGPAPVSIGFGRMPPAEAERLGELIATTVARVGVRAVVQVG
jgi:sterol 3beta-glucosyltransferase